MSEERWRTGVFYSSIWQDPTACPLPTPASQATPLPSQALASYLLFGWGREAERLGAATNWLFQILPVNSG